MTEKKLKKLNRQELLEILLMQSKKIDRLQAQLHEAQEKLEAKELSLSKAGSIAEASLALSGVFEDAQKAADQYLENIRLMQEKTKIECAQKKKAADLYVRERVTRSKFVINTIVDIPYRINLYWDDEGFEQNRPDEVTVKIYRNRELINTVIFKSENNWTYEWTASDDGSVWEIVGENVAKYTFTTKKIGNNFLLEYHTTEKPDDTPGTQPTKTDAPSKPHIPGISPKTGDDSNPMIAVVFMAVSGMFLILFGILSKRREQENE